MVTLDVAAAQQRADYAGYLQLLSAEQSYQTAISAFKYARRQAIAIHELAGGWRNRLAARVGGLPRSRYWRRAS